MIVIFASGVKGLTFRHTRSFCARQSAGSSEYLSSAPLKWSSWPDIPASIRDDKTLDRRSCTLLGEGIIYRCFEVI